MAKRARAGAQQRQAAPPGAKRRKGPRKSDLYEADDSEPEEDKHTDRYDVSSCPRSAAAPCPGRT
jgi:hypothetical protein